MAQSPCVIPALAGIQYTAKRRCTTRLAAAEDQLHSPVFFLSSWIPAGAGMTSA